MLISEDYLRLQRELHGNNPRYGAASVKFAGAVQDLIKTNRPKTALDYGAGKRLLRSAITGVDLSEYDPCVAGIAEPPNDEFDMVCCIDVLEHVEPDCVDAVLSDIARLTRRFAFLTIHTGPAGKFLSDGRNAHLTQKPIEWWEQRISQHFHMLYVRHVAGKTYSVEAWKA